MSHVKVLLEQFQQKQTHLFKTLITSIKLNNAVSHLRFHYNFPLGEGVRHHLTAGSVAHNHAASYQEKHTRRRKRSSLKPPFSLLLFFFWPTITISLFYQPLDSQCLNFLTLPQTNLSLTWHAAQTWTQPCHQTLKEH